MRRRLQRLLPVCWLWVWVLLLCCKKRIWKGRGKGDLEYVWGEKRRMDRTLSEYKKMELKDEEG